MDDNHSWYSDFPRQSIGSGGLEARGRATLEMLKRLGVSPHPSSRLPAAVSLLMRLNDGEIRLTPDDIGLQQRTAQAQRTIWEFFTIAYAADLRRGKWAGIFPPERIKLALSGAEEAANDRNHLHRNTQFELYVAAMLCHGGAEVRYDERPDLQLLVGTKEFGVAVKRLNSENPDAIAARLREGANQIAASGSPGYIAINIDVHYKSAMVGRDDQARHRLFNEKTLAVLETFKRHCENHISVKGAIIYGHVSAWDFEGLVVGHQCDYPTSFQLIADEADVSELNAVEHAFWSGYLSRVQRQTAYMLSPSFSG